MLKVLFIDFFDLFNSKPAVWFEVCLCYAPYCPSPAKGNYSFLPAEKRVLKFVCLTENTYMFTLLLQFLYFVKVRSLLVVTCS